MKEFLKSISAKVGLAAGATATTVLTAFKAITCDDLTKYQSMVPDDVTNVSLWISAIVTLVLGWVGVKRSKAAHPPAGK